MQQQQGRQGSSGGVAWNDFSHLKYSEQEVREAVRSVAARYRKQMGGRHASTSTNGRSRRDVTTPSRAATASTQRTFRYGAALSYDSGARSGTSTAARRVSPRSSGGSGHRSRSKASSSSSSSRSPRSAGGGEAAAGGSSAPPPPPPPTQPALPGSHDGESPAAAAGVAPRSAIDDYLPPQYAAARARATVQAQFSFDPDRFHANNNGSALDTFDAGGSSGGGGGGGYGGAEAGDGGAGRGGSSSSNRSRTEQGAAAQDVDLYGDYSDEESASEEEEEEDAMLSSHGSPPRRSPRTRNAKRRQNERAAAQKVFERLQTELAHREVLSKEVRELRKALHRRQSVVPAFLKTSAIATDAPMLDKAIQVLPSASVRGTQTDMEVTESEEVAQLKTMVLQLRQLLRQAKARTAAKQQEVDSLAAQIRMAAADTEEARAEVQAAQEALAVQAKEAAATLEAELHKDTANKSIGTDLTWSNFHSETQRQVSELSAAVLKRDTMLEQAQAEMQRMRSELSRKNGGSPSQRLDSVLADLHATQRELESTRGQLAEARATLASQAKALEMAAAQQNRMTSRVEDELKQLLSGQQRATEEAAAAAAAAAASAAAAAQRSRRPSPEKGRTTTPSSPTQRRSSGGGGGGGGGGGATRTQRNSFDEDERLLAEYKPMTKRKSSSSIKTKSSTPKGKVKKKHVVTRRSSRVVGMDASFMGRFEKSRNVGVLKKSTLFGAMTDQECEALLEACTVLLFKDGEYLLHQGERSNFMFIVASGHVSVVREEAGGGTRELVRRSPGEVVGEFAIFSDDPRKASVTARGQTKVLMLTRDKYLELYSASEAGSALQKVLERITTVPTGAGASSAPDA